MKSRIWTRIKIAHEHEFFEHLLLQNAIFYAFPAIHLSCKTEESKSSRMQALSRLSLSHSTYYIPRRFNLAIIERGSYRNDYGRSGT